MQAAIAQAFEKDPSRVSRAISKLLESGLIARDKEERLVAK
jgi:predicted transcriptional regulator